MLYNIIVLDRHYRGVAQFGRALRSGRRGRGFESRRLDQKSKFDFLSSLDFSFLNVFSHSPVEFLLIKKY